MQIIRGRIRERTKYANGDEDLKIQYDPADVERWEETKRALQQPPAAEAVTDIGEGDDAARAPGLGCLIALGLGVLVWVLAAIGAVTVLDGLWTWARGGG